MDEAGSWMKCRSFAAPAAILSIAFLACAGTAKRETSSLVAALDRYRRANNASKAAEVDQVALVTCTDARVCGAKSACLAAIGPTARALLLKDEVARGLADIEQKRVSPDSPAALALPGKLAEAETLLVQGRAKMADCEKQLTDLEVEFGT